MQTLDARTPKTKKELFTAVGEHATPRTVERALRRLIAAGEVVKFSRCTVDQGQTPALYLRAYTLEGVKLSRRELLARAKPKIDATWKVFVRKRARYAAKIIRRRQARERRAAERKGR